ncbi:hypothetical protein Bca4012_092054 [Brassica carinata]
MERSEEQFVKEMEVTRRNSEPASQKRGGARSERGAWNWRDGGERVGEREGRNIDIDSHCRKLDLCLWDS